MTDYMNLKYRQTVSAYAKAVIFSGRQVDCHFAVLECLSNESDFDYTACPA